MKFLLVVVLAVLLVATESKILPASNVESQQTNTQLVPDSLQLTDYIKNTQDMLKNVTTQLQQQLNLPNQEEVVNTLREQSTNFANRVQEYINTVSDEVKAKGPELENLWENMKTKLSDMVTQLNVNPETSEQVNQLHTKFQEGVQTIVTESENAAKTISENSSKVQEGIAKFTKHALDIALNASQNLNNQLQQATTEQQPN